MFYSFITHLGGASTRISDATPVYIKPKVDNLGGDNTLPDVTTKGPKPEVGKSYLSATYINASNHKESEHESANCLLREGDTRLCNLVPRAFSLSMFNSERKERKKALASAGQFCNLIGF